MQKADLKKTDRRVSPLPIFVLFFLVLLLISPTVSFEYMRGSLKLCVQSLVPSLFPFMIISDFLISSDTGKILKALFAHPLSFIFGTSREGSFAVLLGFLCGFPIGAKSSLKLYEENKISHTELCHIMSFCNIPSPAFMCGAVGLLFQNSRLGVILFVSLLLSSLILGIVGRFIYKYDRKAVPVSQKRTDAVNAFTSAVSSSAAVMLTVCAYVVFFSVLIGYATRLCNIVVAPKIIPVILSGLLEISNGMSCAAGLGGNISPILAAFFAGFSGLSVIFQIISLDRGRYISRKSFVLQKLLQGVLCSIICFVLLKFFPMSVNPSAPTLNDISLESYGLYICFLFFISAALPLLAMLFQRKKGSHEK